jgi:isochorismate hydrolase
MRRRLDRDCFIIVGIYKSIGFHSSAIDAFAREIRAFAVADAMADFDPQDHKAGLGSISRLFAWFIDIGGVLSADSNDGARVL